MSKLTVYNASAGSGKTFSLALEYIYLLICNPSSYRNILAITFTNKATGEMKQRIISCLIDLGLRREKNDFFNVLCTSYPKLKEEDIFTNSKLALSNIVHDYSFFSIQTIDSFLQKIMRNMTKELGIASAYNIVLSDQQINEQAIDRLIEITDTNTPLFDWYMDMVTEKMENAKAPNVRKELISFSENLSKEDFGIYAQKLTELQSGEIKAFKDKANKEINEFWALVNRYIVTFDDINKRYGLDQADYCHTNTGLWGAFARLRNKDINIFTPRIISCNQKGKCIKTNDAAEQEVLALFANVSDFIQANREKIETLQVELQHIGNVGLIKDILTLRNQVLNENNQVLLSSTSQILAQMISAGGAIDVPFIYEKISTFLHNIMIDEMQDTSRKNWETLRALVLESLDNGFNSTLLGDVKQSIYRWRNASWDILNNIEQEIDNHQVKKINLNTNFRSSVSVVEFNNYIFSQGVESLLSEIENLPECFRLNEPQRESIGKIFAKDKVQNPHKNIQGQVRCLFFEKDKSTDLEQEKVNKRIINEIEHYHNIGYDYSQITLLFRKNKELMQTAEFLSSKGYNVISDTAFAFGTSVSVVFIINALRYLAMEDNVALLSIMGKVPDSENKPFEWLNDRNKLLNKSLFDLIVYIIGEAKLDNSKSEIVFLSAFCDKVQEYIADNGSNISNFLTYWEDDLKGKQVSVAESNSLSALRLYTIHKAKGLEFPVVIIPYSFPFFDSKHTHLWLKDSEQNVPAFYIDWRESLINTKFANDYANERYNQYMDSLNLMYVALTRSKECLSVMSYLPSKSSGKKTQECVDSLSKYLYMCLIDKLQSIEQGNDSFSLYETNPQWNNPSKDTHKTTQEQWIDIDTLFYHNTNVSYAQRKEASDFLNALQEEDQPQSKQENTYSSKTKGIALHSIMSEIQSKPSPEQIDKKICSLIAQGNILAKDKERVKQVIDMIMSAENFAITENWFNGSYRVINETSIVTKDDLNQRIVTKKPDRIMLNENNEAIIVDYKFSSSERENKNYIAQVKAYSQLLQQMGYRVTQAWLWYVDTDNLMENSRLERII